MRKLNPCLICGGEAEFHKYFNPDESKVYICGRCTECGISAKPATKECIAVKNWNWRKKGMRGRWEKARPDSKLGYWVCSCCGFVSAYIFASTTYDTCLACGAEMEVENE